MIRAQDLKGVVAMMPAFTTADGDSLDATDTIDTETLIDSVDKIIKDGANGIATMGSFGEFHTLLWEEKKNLIEATIARCANVCRFLSVARLFTLGKL